MFPAFLNYQLSTVKCPEDRETTCSSLTFVHLFIPNKYIFNHFQERQTPIGLTLQKQRFKETKRGTFSNKFVPLANAVLDYMHKLLL